MHTQPPPPPTDEADCIQSYALRIGDAKELIDCAKASTVKNLELYGDSPAGSNDGHTNNPKYVWNTDSSGKPGAFKAWQHMGRIMFSWTDYSLCEKAFALTRDGVSFVAGPSLAPPRAAGSGNEDDPCSATDEPAWHGENHNTKPDSAGIDQSRLFSVARRHQYAERVCVRAPNGVCCMGDSAMLALFVSHSSA